MAQYASLAVVTEDVTSLRHSSRSLRCLHILPYLPAGSTKAGRSICCGLVKPLWGRSLCCEHAVPSLPHPAICFPALLGRVGWWVALFTRSKHWQIWLVCRSACQAMAWGGSLHKAAMFISSACDMDR